MSALVAVVPVRAGIVPAGGAEAVAEASGRAIVIGGDAPRAELGAVATEITIVDVAVSDPIAWARAIAEVLDSIGSTDSVVLPASPDGRDIAPHLARALGIELFSGATEVTPNRVRVARRGGLTIVEHRPDSRFVTTLQPGVRGVDTTTNSAPTVRSIPLAAPASSSGVTSTEVLPPDASTMDLAEAPRIVGGGAGLENAEMFSRLAEFAHSIDASMGVTRVITDRGWATHERQIGTTGVVVDPTLYLAFGISGAVQHTSGLGQPDHIISVNTDAHCPMMQMADLAIVADANAVLHELATLLTPDGAT